MEKPEERAARQNLILAIKRAKRCEINVGAVFYEVEAELKLLHYRLFGAMLAGGFVVSAPILIRVMDMACLHWKLGTRMDYTAIDWLCLAVGIPSMLAFGWKLVKPVDRTAVEKMIPAIEDITHRMQALHDDDGADGDV